MKNATFSLGVILVFLLSAVNVTTAQTTEPLRLKGKAVEKNTQHEATTKRATTVDAQKLQATYNHNLVQAYGKAIGKEVFSVADFNGMDANKQAYVATRPNEFLVIADPINAAKDYFTQQKAN